MSDANREDTQVIIVGGGPVGMGLAIELGQRGIHCVVIERYTSPQPIPKGQNLTQRTMEHFYFGARKRPCGLREQFHANMGLEG
jgi:flavin-dependent dehydrogenase